MNAERVPSSRARQAGLQPHRNGLCARAPDDRGARPAAARRHRDDDDREPGPPDGARPPSTRRTSSSSCWRCPTATRPRTRASFPPRTPAAAVSPPAAAPIRPRRSELYVDYLDIDGALLPSVGTTAPANWYYKRVWQVARCRRRTCKRITVTATVKSAVGSVGPHSARDRRRAQDISLLRRADDSHADLGASARPPQARAASR